MSATGPCIIIDNGASVKWGFGGDESPRGCVDAVVGHPKIEFDFGEGFFEVGSVALSHRQVMRLRYPIDRGLIFDWSEMEILWDHVFKNGVNLDPAESGEPILMTEPPLNIPQNRDKMATVLFETVGVHALSIQCTCRLSLFASGRTTGIIVDVGDGVTHACPIYEGYELNDPTNRMNMAGRDVTEFLATMIEPLSHIRLRGLVKNIKEKMCYVAYEFDDELQKCDEEQQLGQYAMPDGSALDLSREALFRAPEIFFRPSLVGKERLVDLPKMCYDSIQNCDVDIRKDMYQNIVLAGGGTLFEGFVERMTREIQEWGPKSSRIKVNAPMERLYSAWIGGSIVSDLSTFENALMKKEEFAECGVSLLRRKFGISFC